MPLPHGHVQQLGLYVETWPIAWRNDVTPKGGGARRQNALADDCCRVEDGTIRWGCIGFILAIYVLFLTVFVQPATVTISRQTQLVFQYYASVASMQVCIYSSAIGSTSRAHGSDQLSSMQHEISRDYRSDIGLQQRGSSTAPHTIWLITYIGELLQWRWWWCCWWSAVIDYLAY